MKLASALLISVAKGNEKKVPPRHPLQRLTRLVEFGDEYFELFEGHFPDKFVERWSGPEGKFAKNAERMENAFTRGNQRCGYYSAENLPHGGPGSRERRSMSDDFERWAREDPVKGMRDILTGFRKWSERYISDCSGQRNHQHMVNRFNGFQDRFDELFDEIFPNDDGVTISYQMPDSSVSLSRDNNSEGPYATALTIPVLYEVKFEMNLATPYTGYNTLLGFRVDGAAEKSCGWSTPTFYLAPRETDINLVIVTCHNGNGNRYQTNILSAANFGQWIEVKTGQRFNSNGELVWYFNAGTEVAWEKIQTTQEHFTNVYLNLGEQVENRPDTTGGYIRNLVVTEPSVGTLFEWTAWGTCSAHCDGGLQERTRTCYGNNCMGDLTEEQVCNEHQCVELENEKIWHGEENIATYKWEGGYRPTFADMRLGRNMFDNDDTSIWCSVEPVTNPRKVEVTFHNKIDFNKLVIVKRSDGHSSWRKRYKNVCLSLDDVQVSCTSEIYGNGADDRETSITWQYFQKKVQKVTLQFNHATDPAQVADLKIHYQREIRAGEWGEWSECTGCWTDCTKTRTRTCEDEDAIKCSEPLSETAACEVKDRGIFGDMGWIWANRYASQYVNTWLRKYDLDQCWRFSGGWWNDSGHKIGIAAAYIVIRGCGHIPQDVQDANNPRYWDNRSVDHTIPDNFKNTTMTDPE